MNLAVSCQERKGESRQSAIRGELAAAARLNDSESLRCGLQPKRERKSEWQSERKSRFDWMDAEPLLKLRRSWSEVLHSAVQKF